MSHKLVDYFYSQPLYIESDVLPTLSDTALATLKFRTPPHSSPSPVPYSRTIRARGGGGGGGGAEGGGGNTTVVHKKKERKNNN